MYATVLPSAGVFSILLRSSCLLMSPFRVKRLFAHSGGSKSRSLTRSLVTCDRRSQSGVFLVWCRQRRSKYFGKHDPTARHTRMIIAHHRMKPQHLAGQASFIPCAPRDDTAVGFGDEAVAKISPLISSGED
ncbi:hypothetical protein EDD15DRAFT_872671 [Pisolithus albus]|nr:hypothetical protein EDD15DRAFT_872671 [Pisolithus albus]